MMLKNTIEKVIVVLFILSMSLNNISCKDFIFDSVVDIKYIPSLLLPEDNAIDVSNTPVLSWSERTGSTGYILQVSDDNLFTNLIINENVQSTSYTVKGLGYNLKYYWRVIVKDNGKLSQWSKPRSFTTVHLVASPSLSAPSNGSLGHPLTPALVWKQSSLATSYYLEVSEDSLFTRVIYRKDQIVETSKQIDSLKQNKIYYWRVSASNIYGTSGFSEFWKFGTAGETPAIPELISPMNQSIGNSLNPALCWNSSKEAQSYNLQLATDKNFNNVIATIRGIKETSSIVNNLVGNNIYYWRVSASNINSTSPYSTAWSFGTTGKLPETPVLLAPINGLLGNSLTPALGWKASENSSAYNVQISTDNNFVNIIYNKSDITETSVFVNNLENNKIYFWRVRGININGYSDFSNIWSFGTAGNVPSIPILASPINGSLGNSLTPALSWNKTQDAETYNLQIATNPEFSDIIYSKTNIIETSHQVNGLVPNKLYYWRVSASNINGMSEYSTIWSFGTTGNLPEVPILAAPYNGALGNPLSPALSWNASKDAQSYHLQVATNPLFNNLAFNQTGITEMSQKVTGLVSNKVYYWRVRAANINGYSSFSEIWSFGTTGTIPQAPSLSAPANGSLGNSLTPALSWSSSADASSYNLQVATDLNFYNLVFNQSGIASNSQQISGLIKNSVYYWRVSASNLNGTSAFSQVWSFGTTGNIPGVPSHLAPSNGSLGNPLTPALSWNASSDALSYTIQVSANSSFTNLVYNKAGITTTSEQISGLNNNTMYYWRVKAVNINGESNYSASWNFGTTGSLPSVPTLSTPINGTMGLPLTSILSWNPSNNAATYNLQISTDGNFNNILYDQSGIISNSQQVSGLVGSRLYFWRVRASNINGNSAFSEIWNFGTIGNAPASPTPNSPANKSIWNSLSPALSWNASTGASSYSLQVSAKSDFSNIVYEQSNITFTSHQVNNLSANTTYYWRVNATNINGSSGWSSPVWSFVTMSLICPGTTFYSGKTYNIVQIGNKCWFRENLDVGSLILVNSEQTNNSQIEKYCYGNNQYNCQLYGGLYQWNEAMQYNAGNAQGICPTGWHIPNFAEYQSLITAVNSDGNALKNYDLGTGAGIGNNSSGFTALLAGYRATNQTFGSLNVFTYFWSSTESNSTSANVLGLFNDSNYLSFGSGNKSDAFSIRCVKDNP